MTATRVFRGREVPLRKWRLVYKKGLLVDTGFSLGRGWRPAGGAVDDSGLY